MPVLNWTTKLNSKPISTLTQELTTTASAGNISNVLAFIQIKSISSKVTTVFIYVVIIYLQDQGNEKGGALVSP